MLFLYSPPLKSVCTQASLIKFTNLFWAKYPCIWMEIYEMTPISSYYSLSSNFRAFWLAPVIRNILGYNFTVLWPEPRWHLVQDIFRKQNLSDKWSSCKNKYQLRRRRTLACRCLLVGRELFSCSQNLQQNRKNALDKVPIEWHF